MRVRFKKLGKVISVEERYQFAILTIQNEALRSGTIVYFMFCHVRNLPEIGGLRRGFPLAAHKHHLLGIASISKWFIGLEQISFVYY